jgi:hypothetical protein
MGTGTAQVFEIFGAKLHSPRTASRNVLHGINLR